MIKRSSETFLKKIGSSKFIYIYDQIILVMNIALN